MKRQGVSALAMLLLSTAAFAQNAQDELERQLKEMVGTPPTKIRVAFVGLDEPQYRVEEAVFYLDGTQLPKVSAGTLNPEGEHIIWHGDVKPGQHRVTAKVTIADVASFMLSKEAGFKWPVELNVGFKSDPGIEVQINVTPKINRVAPDTKNRISLTGPATLKMLAKLEDGSMPPSPKANLGRGEEVDAGVAVASADQALTPAERAKQKREAAAAAAAEKKRLAAEARAAAVEAAADKKRLAVEARAAAAAAAAEKKRAAAEALAAKKSGTAVPTNGGGEQVAVVPTVVDAGPELVAEAVIDAGEPFDAGVAVAVVKPVAPTPVVAEEGGLPWPIIIGGGIAALGLIIFLVARRKKS